MHLGQAFRNFCAVLRGLNGAQLTHGGVRSICGFATSKYFSHLARIEAEHRVLLELEALVDLILGEFGGNHANADGIGTMHCRDEGVVLRVHTHHTGCLRLLLGQECVIFERWSSI